MKIPKQLILLSPAYLESFSSVGTVDWHTLTRNLKLSGYTNEDIEYHFIASSLFSSKIEGNTLDLNTFMREGNEIPEEEKEFQEIKDLISAYRFVNREKITQGNFLKAHQLLSKTILQAKERGQYRKTKVGVFDSHTGQTIYLAVEADQVKGEVTKLFADINILLESDLSYKEIFYYASMIHLWIAMIHPFTDGNGRAARLMEKWFLLAKIGSPVWSVNSEKYYWDNRPKYYKKISLGSNYNTLKWKRCVPFLLMLPKALKKGNYTESN